MPTLLFSFLLGGFCGSRTMLPTAVLCWFAFLGRLHVDGTWFAFLANPLTVAIFTIATAAELLVDKLPITPSRLKWPLLIARLCAGAFVGSVLATQNFQIKEYGYYGALIGLSGALLGALIGYMLRTRLVTHFHLPDYGVALAEDCIAIAGSIGVVAWAMNYVVVC